MERGAEARIVAESYRTGESVSGVARRHGVHTSELFRWRRRFGKAAGTGAGFVPVVVETPDNTRIQYEQDPTGVWPFTAKGLLGHLRDTWESAVEGVVAPVLRTFSSKVNTRGFYKLSAITLQDADDMRAGYGRCSTLLHNASDALNPTVPTPDQIADELSALRYWIDILQTRQDHINTA